MKTDTTISTSQPQPRDGEAGFSLVETCIAMGILATGLMSMAGVFVLGMAHLAGSSANLIAREKAREAIESVHTARDTKVITWAQIRNVADGGVFLGGALPLNDPGPDGLVNTADDLTDHVEETLAPGPDNLLGTEDDVHMPLTTYTREITILPVLTNGVANPTLRQLRVKVTYLIGPDVYWYELNTYISSIS